MLVKMQGMRNIYLFLEGVQNHGHHGNQYEVSSGCPSAGVDSEMTVYLHIGYYSAVKKVEL